MTYPDTSRQTELPVRSLHPATTLGVVALKVADVNRSIEFYTRIIGLRLLDRPTAGSAVMGTDQPVLLLREIKGAAPASGRTTGLYHAAILLPDRPSLARTIWHLHQIQVQFGYADHLVSEAFYLADPDNNGLELYRDRPRSEWKWQQNMVQMANAPIDFDSLFAELRGDTSWNGMPDGTRLGHMHLQIGDLEQAQAFYVNLLGFDLVSRFPGALFVSAGGYHHHLGLNTWNSRNAPPAPATSAGLDYFTVVLPDVAELKQLADRFKAAGVEVAIEREDQELIVHDPWRNQVRLVVASV